MRAGGSGRILGAFAVGLAVLPVSYAAAMVVFPEDDLYLADVPRLLFVLPVGSIVGGCVAAVVTGRGQGTAGWTAMLGGTAGYLVL